VVDAAAEVRFVFISSRLSLFASSVSLYCSNVCKTLFFHSLFDSFFRAKPCVDHDQAKHIVDESYDYEAARAKLKEAAEKYKYAPALNEYDQYLYYGRGGLEDEPGAVKCYQLAADMIESLGFFASNIFRNIVFQGTINHRLDYSSIIL
jgi:hypothetical protein